MTDLGAIEAGARAIGQWLQPGTWLRADNDEELGPRHWERLTRVVLEAALPALLAAGWTPPEGEKT